MNDIDDSADQIWLGRARTLLDESAQNLDAATLSRLHQARGAALTQHRPRQFRGWFLSAGLASVCALLLLMAVMHPVPPAPGTVERAAATTATSTETFSHDDMNIVSGDDSLELYQDLEFYAWLDAQDQGNDG